MENKGELRQEGIAKLAKIQDEKIANILSTAVLPVSLSNKKSQALSLLKAELSLNIDSLMECTNDLIAENPEMSERDLTIELLKTFAEFKSNTQLGKIAEKMVKKKWWEKHE